MFELMPLSRNERALFNHFFGGEQLMEKSFRLKVDVEDKGDRYMLSADLPGFRKEDISIDIDGKYLSINARREEKNEQEGRNFVYRERRSGSFCRSFDITGIQADEIRGSFENGVLSLNLPKEAAQLKGSRRLELSGGEEQKKEADAAETEQEN